MAKKETIDVLVEGGKATAAPPLGPALGPLKINIGQVVAEINKKTASFHGMKVPVKVTVDHETKAFEISVGTPPTSQLIKKEFNIQKGSGTPNKQKIGNVAIEHLIKISKMKMESMFTNSLKTTVKTVAGSCNAMGLLIEGMTADQFNKELESGKFNKELQEERTKVTKEKEEVLKDQLEKVQKDLQKLQTKEVAEEGEKKEEKKVEEAAKEAPKKETKK